MSANGETHERDKMRPLGFNERRRIIKELHETTPPFFRAVAADARAFRDEPGRRRPLLGAIRLGLSNRAFASLAIYRLRARLLSLGVPAAPRVLHGLSILLGKVFIGDPVVIAPGIRLARGPLVVDGLIKIGSGAVIGPSVTIGLRTGNVHGPVLAEGVEIEAG